MTNISGVSESVRQLINTQSFSLSCTNNVDSYLCNFAYAVSMTRNILSLPLSPGSSYSSFQICLSNCRSHPLQRNPRHAPTPPGLAQLLFTVLTECIPLSLPSPLHTLIITLVLPSLLNCYQGFLAFSSLHHQA